MAYPITGTTDVGTAGSREQIDNTPRRVLSITFRGRLGNTGKVYIGGSAVAANAGFELGPGEAISFNFSSAFVSGVMNDFYVDAESNGDDVDWMAILWP